jgi:uncharacterized membrane protein
MILPQLLVTAVFLLCGVIMMRFPPKKINPLYGYRTLASMRSEEAWKFAQKLSARRFILLSAFSAVITLLVWLAELQEPWVPLIMIASLIGGFIYMFKSVEKKLTQRFPQP